MTPVKMTSRGKKILDLAVQSVQDPGLSAPHLILASPLQAPQPSPPQVEPSLPLLTPPSPPPQAPTTSLPEAPISPPPQASTSSDAYNKGTYYLSSSESEPFQDSGDSYKPSDGEVDSADHSSSEEEVEDEVPDVPDVDNAADVWGPCKDIPRNFQFSGQHGLKVNHLDLSEPYNIYKQFLTDEILDKIVVETNRYASHIIQTKRLPRRSLMHKWTNTNRAEIKKFIAILMIMGINKLPQMRLYWSSNDMYSNECVKKTMTRNRFDVLLRCLHFSDNSDPKSENDRLFKIRELIELCCKQFQETLEPGEELVIDESMVPWRGRLVFRQYLPAKSHKYGVKLYKICTPEGYTYDLRVYAGKNGPTNTVAVNSNGHTYNICMELLEKVINSGRIIYMDNFYSSVKLCKDLLERQTYTCGTLRSNRKGNPRNVCSKKLKKGEVFSQQNNDGIRVTKWLDKRPVLMISSVPDHTDQLVATGTKNKGNDVVKPPAVIAYNKAKKGVDISDQMSSYYTTLRKSVKWYKKVCFEIMLGTSVVNALVVYNCYGNGRNKPLNMLAFREKIVEGLLNDTEQIDGADNRNPEKKRKRGKSSHRIGKYEGKARTNRKRCAECYKRIQNEKGSKEARAKASKVLTFCEDCDGTPTMCIPCFKNVHE